MQIKELGRLCFGHSPLLTSSRLPLERSSHPDGRSAAVVRPPAVLQLRACQGRQASLPREPLQLLDAISRQEVCRAGLSGKDVHMSITCGRRPTGLHLCFAACPFWDAA